MSTQRGNYTFTRQEERRRQEADRRAAALLERWLSWCTHLAELDRDARLAWGEYDAIMQEAAELRLSPWLDLGDVRLDWPARLAPIRYGEGAIKWRP